MCRAIQSQEHALKTHHHTKSILTPRPPSHHQPPVILTHVHAPLLHRRQLSVAVPLDQVDTVMRATCQLEVDQAATATRRSDQARRAFVTPTSVSKSRLSLF